MSLSKTAVYNVLLALLAVATFTYFFIDPSNADSAEALPDGANEAIVSNAEKPVEEKKLVPNVEVADKKSASETVLKNVSPKAEENGAANISTSKVAKKKSKNPNAFTINPVVDVEIKSDLRLEIFDRQTLCLIGAYDNFLRERFATECAPFLRKADSPSAKIPQWSRNMFYNILGAEVILKYRPKISEAYANVSGFKLEDGSGKVQKIGKGAYWLNPIGQATFYNVFDNSLKLTRNAFVRHYAFLKTADFLREGEKYKLTNPLGQSVDFVYSEKSNVSAAIKLNRVGYSPSAKRKYAYVGAWLSELGALDISALDGKNFSICNTSGEVVFSSKITRRPPDSNYSSGASFSGEDVAELDFSAFDKEGDFYIHVPTVGRSVDFRISNDAVGDAFYTHAKGLYHKRCGIAKKAPYTNWIMGECHMHTYLSDFPPNNLTYRATKNPKAGGFFDADAKGVSVSHFKLIGLRATKEATNLHGGWHDAADYDRRPYHYDVVNDLLSAYIFRPKNFADGQLNIPESGNGIADILDEAEWGMRLWLSAQGKEGSVGGWIEATSHPVDYNPSTDTQPYYLSAATRESTMQYAAHASMLALAFKISGNVEMQTKYFQSAKLAFNWASNPSNRFEKSYKYPTFNKGAKNDKNVKVRDIKYIEPANPPVEFLFKAAFNLYKLSGDKSYLKICSDINMSQKFAETSWRVNPLLFSEFIKYGAEIKELKKNYAELRKRMLRYADERLNWLENAYQYRIAWYPPKHRYVSHMSWGKSHPLVLAKFFVNAYELTKDQKYRDAAYLSNDWHNGANPFGQTMTSGLGDNYPIRFLDLPSYSDNINEYILGITPYRNTFGISRDSTRLGHSLVYNPRPDRDFAPAPRMLLPKSMIGEPSVSEFESKLGKLWPIWRRWANVEAFSVAASEYTVSETIAPAAALTGWLLEEGYKPSDTIKNKKPAKNLKELKGYFPMP